MSNREMTPQSVISGEWIALFMLLFIVALNFDKIWKFNEKNTNRYTSNEICEKSV